MKFVGRVVPIENTYVYNGTSEKGAYTINTWKLRGIDTKEFTATCFGADSDYLERHKNLEVDCDFELTGRLWNGKLFNDVKITKIDKSDEPVQQQVVPPMQNNLSSPGPGEGSDLPF